MLSPEVGGLCDGVFDAETIPLMSMVGEVRDERGVSMVGGITLEDMGGDLDLPLPDEDTSSVAKKGKYNPHSPATEKRTLVPVTTTSCLAASSTTPSSILSVSRL